eukprot:RCo019638
MGRHALTQNSVEWSCVPSAASLPSPPQTQLTPPPYPASVSPLSHTLPRGSALLSDDPSGYPSSSGPTWRALPFSLLSNPTARPRSGPEPYPSQGSVFPVDRTFSATGSAAAAPETPSPPSALSPADPLLAPTAAAAQRPSEPHLP